MTFIFNSTQLAAIQAAVDNAPVNGYAAIYETILGHISNLAGDEPDETLTDSEIDVWLWVRGACQVNTNDGSFFSDFIREYTNQQHILREGMALTGGEIQTASNEIALAFANDILSSTYNHELPTIERTALYDAGRIASLIFDGNYSPWAGTLLFPFLTHADVMHDWLLNTETVPVYKPLPGTYDLISSAIASFNVISELSEGDALAANNALLGILANNSLGYEGSGELLDGLREAANTFFQNAYGLPDIGDYQIGGDLPLYYSPIDIFGAFEYLDRPNYYVGKITADIDLQGSAEEGVYDIINAGGGTLLGSSAINATGNTLDNILTGNSGVNTLSGSSGEDTLDGGAGADTLIGGTDNDVYIVDDAGDVVSENASAGTDIVQSSISYTLGSNVENLTLTGSSNLNGTGNSLNNAITGNSGDNTISGADGNDVLDGGAGADTLTGGIGNDTFVVDNAGDVVTENASQGTDLVRSGISYTLGSNVENLTLTGSGNLNGTGNSLNNTITGNSGDNTISGADGNDVLDGGAGADTLTGGIGNDTFVVDNASDVVSENASEGTDRVQSSISYTLGSNVENLTLTGSAGINGTGNALNNAMTGNSGVNTLDGGDGNDVLDGGTGADTLIGGIGNDTFTVDNAGDVLVENSAEGTDFVQADVSYTLGANIENMALSAFVLSGTGNSLNNVIDGNASANTLVGLGGNDTLDGAAGNDTMSGGTGDDVYYVRDAGDVIIEDSGEGTVRSSVTRTLGSNLENLVLMGSSSINGTGNSLDNIITGNSGNNVLDGSTGADTLYGGDGLDTLTGGSGIDAFVFEAATAYNNIDVITDFTAGSGNDVVNISSLMGSYTPGVDTLTDFVQAVNDGSGGSYLQVDRDGTGGTYSFQSVAQIQGITGINVNTWATNGNLTVS